MTSFIDVEKDLINEESLNFNVDNLQCVVIHSILTCYCLDQLFDFFKKHECLYFVENGELKVYKNTVSNLKESIEKIIIENAPKDMVKAHLFESLFYGKKIEREDIIKYSEKMNNTVFTN